MLHTTEKNTHQNVLKDGASKSKFAIAFNGFTIEIKINYEVRIKLIWIHWVSQLELK